MTGSDHMIIKSHIRFQCRFDTRWKGCERSVFGRFRLGFRWCLAFSHPLPTSLIFVFVYARFRYGFCPPTAAFSLSLEGFQRCSFDTRWKGCERSVFCRFGFGFRWCLAFSHPLPTSLIFVFVYARFRYGFCPPTAAFSLSLEGFKGAVSTSGGRLANGAFLVVLGSDLGGVWPFRIHCRRAWFLSLSTLGSATVFVHLLRPFPCL